MKSIHNKSLLILVILSLAIFFRFFKIHDFLIFGMDQENEILIVKNIASGKHFPLIGLSSSDTGTYRGPVFLYLSAIPYIISGGNPVGGAITASLLGVVVSFLIYKIGVKMLSPPIGILGALFYSVSFLAAYYDRQFWNPTFIPLFSLLIGYISFEATQRKSYFLLLLLVFLFGLATHAHLTILIFIPLIVWTLWMIRSKLSLRRLLVLISILMLTQLPLIFFDLRHNFLNAKALINTVTNIGGKVQFASTLSERTQLVLTTLGRFIWIPPIADFSAESGQCKELLTFMKDQKSLGMMLIIFIIGSLILWHFDKPQDKKNSKALAILLVITLQLVLFVIFYNRYILQYYFTFYFPWISLLLAWCTVFLWRKKYAKFILLPAILLFIILNTLTMITSRYSFSYKEKTDALKFVSKKLQNHPFSLEALGECPRFGGLRYLAEHKVGVPIHSYMDSYFAWLYPETIRNNPEARIVLLSMIDSRNSPDLIAQWEGIKLQYLISYNLIADSRFGKIHALILSHK